MKGAFAKLMEKNPVQSSHTAFRAGGNGVPILTRASASSTSGYQTMGLPTGSRPAPGGGANKTTLGAYRMGDQEGNAAASAIYPGDIFGPIGQPGRVYPERTFANVGNNVYQPENDDKATLALLRRLGDQKFKAMSDAPFEEYVQQQKLASALHEAGKNASLADQGVAREIIRNIAAERRQQNESDYLRRMLDSGATPEAAQQEIQNIRNANAIQEARKIDDRTYQSKLLIQRMAAARGVTPMVQEPLNQSSAIDNPQRSQAMSQAMGMPGEGFGTSPLDQRQFITPLEQLRRDGASQEASDEQSAFTRLLAQGEIPEPASGAYSMATMRGQERQNQVELASEGLAARLESMRSRGNRIYLPLSSPMIAKDILDALYRTKGKRVNDNVLYSNETIQDLRPAQLLLALNVALSMDRNGTATLKRLLEGRYLGTAEKPSPTIQNDLREIVQLMNRNEPNISIPFASTNLPITNSQLVTILQDIRTSNASMNRPSQSEAAAVAAPQMPVGLRVLSKGADMPGSPVSAMPSLPGSPASVAPPRRIAAPAQAPQQRPLNMMFNADLIQMLRSKGLDASNKETKGALIARIKSRPDLFNL